MTAQTPTSAVEALRAELCRLDHCTVPCQMHARWAERLAALAASQEAPKAGDVERIDIPPGTVLSAVSGELGTPSFRVVCQWPDLKALRLFTAPASQGDAAPAGDAVLDDDKIVALLQQTFLPQNRKAYESLVFERSPPMLPQATYDVPIFALSQFVKHIADALVAAPAPAVEREAVCHCDTCVVVHGGGYVQRMKDLADETPEQVMRDLLRDLAATPPAKAREPAPAVREAVDTAWMRQAVERLKGAGHYNDAYALEGFASCIEKGGLSDYATTQARGERDFAMAAAKTNDDRARRFEAALTECVNARNHDRKLLYASLTFSDAAHAALRDAGLLTEELAVMRGKVIVLAATSYAGHKEGDK